MAKSKAPREYTTREMQQAHTLAALWIEQENEEGPVWNEAQIRKAVDDYKHLKFITTIGKDVVGFAMGLLREEELFVHHVVVSREHRRKGVGKALVISLLAEALRRNRFKAILQIRESNLGAQLFLKGLKFSAVNIIHKYYEDTGEDAYLMERSILDQGVS